MMYPKLPARPACDARERVLEDGGVLGLDAEPPGRLEERVRRRLAVQARAACLTAPSTRSSMKRSMPVTSSTSAALWLLRDERAAQARARCAASR